MNISEEDRLTRSKELSDRFLAYMKNLNEDLADSQYGMAEILNTMVTDGTQSVSQAAQEMLDKLFDAQGNLLDKTDIA